MGPFDSYTGEVRCDCGKQFWKLSRRSCPSCGVAITAHNCRAIDGRITEFTPSATREDVQPYQEDDRPFRSYTGEVRCVCGKQFWKLSRRSCPSCGVNLTGHNCHPVNGGFERLPASHDGVGGTEEQRNRKWWLYADEYADLVINYLAASDKLNIPDKDVSRLKLVKSLVRELETLDSVVRDSSSATCGYISYATAFGVRKVLSTDRFINSLVEGWESLDPNQDVRETIRKRIELKHTMEEQLYRWANQVVDECSDWCYEAKESVKRFFQDAAESSSEYTEEDAARWARVYEQEQERHRQERERLKQEQAVHADTTVTTPTTDDAENNAYAFGCLVAIPFALVGFLIHPIVGIIMFFVVAGIVGSIAKEVGIGQTIFGACVLCYILYRIFAGE